MEREPRFSSMLTSLFVLFARRAPERSVPHPVMEPRLSDQQYRGNQALPYQMAAGCLTDQLWVTKSNQEGERVEALLVFANPQLPVICPVVAVGLFLKEKRSILWINFDKTLFF